MRQSLPGMVIMIILLVLNLFVVPLYQQDIVRWRASEEEMMSDTAALIDKVIDTRTLTDAMLADYNYALAAKYVNYSVKIRREICVVNPDPLNPGKTIVSYVTVDDTSTFEKGDFIIVEVESFGSTPGASVASTIFGMSRPKTNFTLKGKVR